MSRSSLWIVTIAAGIAFFAGGLILYSAVSGYGLVVYLLFSAIPLAAGIGILRKRKWAAYGVAIYLGGQLLLVPSMLGRTDLPPGTIAAVVLLFALLTGLFFFAGRALASTGSRPGSPAGWIAAPALLTLAPFFVQGFVIPSGAMENTLLKGDRILVLIFPRPKPLPGDVVFFRSPIDRRSIQVKRLIGQPGDHIRISNKILYRNGVQQNELYAAHKTASSDSYRDNFPSEPITPLPETAKEMLQKHTVGGEIVVPHGKYFVLGDDRENSNDSRYWGFVDTGDIIGKPLLIYDSEDPSAEDMIAGRLMVRRSIRWERFFRPL